MNFEKTFDKLSELVKVILSKSPRCHDWEHTIRVLRNARLIASKEKKCEMHVVELGALFHDIARPDELNGGVKMDHAKKGAVLTEEILRKEGIDSKLREKIVRCVRRHRYRGNAMPVTIEEKVVYDADKLDSLGAVGIGRAFLFAGRIGARVHNTADEALKSKSYTENDTAYREYLVKLRYLPEKMKTVSGRDVARKRLKFMKEFFSQLDDEVSN